MLPRQEKNWPLELYAYTYPKLNRPNGWALSLVFESLHRRSVNLQDIIAYLIYILLIIDRIEKIIDCYLFLYLDMDTNICLRKRIVEILYISKNLVSRSNTCLKQCCLEENE